MHKAEESASKSLQRLKKTYPALSVTAVGTNSLATSAMLKAGADNGATGENSVVVCAAVYCLTRSGDFTISLYTCLGELSSDF